MLIYHRTSIFESPAQTVVNTVNCVGVMGKGIAEVFRRQYPDMYKAYRRICDQELLVPGKLWLWKTPDRWVLNFPTKMHWRNPSRLEWIDAGLRKFAAEYEVRGITDISFPRLGCGNGGLDWDEVRPLMEARLSDLPITIYVHDFEVDIGSPEHLERHGLRATNRIDRSFEDFIATLREVIENRQGCFRVLQSDRTFTVRFASEEQLQFEFDDHVARIEIDDLRTIWVKLLKGVVTARSASWDSAVTGDHILSVLSELHDVRAVQIQRRTADQPEIAVELRRRRGTQNVVDSAPKTPELAWG